MMKIKPLLYAFGSNARVSALRRGFARVRRGNTFRSFALGRRFGPAYAYIIPCRSTARLARRRASYVFLSPLLNATVQQKRIFSWAFFSASVVASVLSCSVPSEDLPPNVARTMRPVHPRGRAPLPRARTSLARMSIDQARVARGEAGDDDPRRARAGDDGSAPRDRRVSNSAGDVELREIVVERAILNPGETRGRLASSPSSSEDDDASSASSQTPARGGPSDGGEEDDGDETPGPVRGEKTPGTRVVRVVGIEDDDVDGKTEDEGSDGVDFCRICMDPDTTGRRRVFLARGRRGRPRSARRRSRVRPVHLGCACKRVHAHLVRVASASAKPPPIWPMRIASRPWRICEVCATGASERGDARAGPAWRSWLSTARPRKTSGASDAGSSGGRERAGGGENDEAFRRRVGGQRERMRSGGEAGIRACGSWILTRPLIAAAWVRVSGKRPSRFLFCHSFSRTETPVSIDFIPNAFRRSFRRPRRFSRFAFRFSPPRPSPPGVRIRRRRR